MVTYNVELNIKQDGVVDTGIEVTQGDFGEVQLLIRVKDDDSYIMNAVGAEVVFNLPNGYIVTGNATISAGTYTYVFKGNELQSAGKIVAVLTLTFSDGRVSSCSFIFNCRYNSLYDRRIPAGVYITELEAIKEQAQAQVNYLNALIDALQGSLGGTALTRSDLSVAKDETIAGIHAADAVAIKEIYDKFQSYLPMTSLVNNALATVPGVAALDAAMGKALQDQITQQNSNFVSGSYIGNGDPTKRSIDTGGTRIGYIIWSSQGTAIVFYSGAYCKYSTNISAIDGASVGSGAGGFWFKTDSRFLNADGVTYNYQSI